MSIVLYGAAGTTLDGVGPATLYTINTATGLATIVGTIGYSDVRGLALHPVSGSLYAVCCGSEQKLITVNITTGAGSVVTTLSPVTGTATLVGADCTFSSSGTLYVWDETNLPTDRLATVNTTTGVWTTLGASGISSSRDGIDFQSSGTLYLRGGNIFNTVNQTTGAVDVAHPISSTGPANMYNSLVFDASDVGYAIQQTAGNSILCTITPTLTVNATIGTTGVATMNALEFVPVNVSANALSGLYELVPESALTPAKTSDTVYLTITPGNPPVTTQEDRAIPEPSATLYGVGDE